VSSSKQLKQEFQASLDDLVAWLFLNARGATEEQAASGLGNQETQTPATAKVKKITDMVEAYLLRLGGKDKDEVATQMALSSLVRVVKQLNRGLAQAAEDGTAGVDALMSLSRRSNDYFTKFVGNWLNSDAIANHFVFELGGFEFLLDVIGKTEERQSRDPSPPLKDPRGEHLEQITSLPAQTKVDEEPEGSDIFDILYSAEQEGGGDQGTLVQGSCEALASLGLSQDRDEAPLDEPPVLVLGELANKHLVLTEDNTGGSVSSHSKVDWSCNKRAYKNRLMVTHLHGALRNEYWVLFKLQ
jgi:hypothetical protein